jgi:hypothetical protein
MSSPQQPLQQLDVSVYMSYNAAPRRVYLQEPMLHMFWSLYKSYFAPPGLIF